MTTDANNCVSYWGAGQSAVPNGHAIWRSAEFDETGDHDGQKLLGGSPIQLELVKHVEEIYSSCFRDRFIFFPIMKLTHKILSSMWCLKPRLRFSRLQLPLCGKLFRIFPPPALFFPCYVAWRRHWRSTVDRSS